MRRTWGNSGQDALCEGARYAVILGVTSKPTRIELVQLESLILAQNERWRQA